LRNAQSRSISRGCEFLLGSCLVGHAAPARKAACRRWHTACTTETRWRPQWVVWYVGPRRKRQRGWQVTKLGRVRVAGDRRKGDASIDTLKASVVLTVREWRGRSRAEQREGVARCIEEDPRKQKLRRGSRPAKGKTDAGRTDRQLDKTLKARRCLQC